MSADPRPNLLVFMTDQQSADAMHCAGSGHFETPNMDRLAARGTRFTKAYTSQPICVPARCSMITGLMPHQTGVICNQSSGVMQGTSLGPLFREAGYTTAYFGKWHIEHDPNDHAWHGFEHTAHLRGNRLDEAIMAPAEAFLLKPHAKPFLMVASFVNPHDICEVSRMLSADHEDSLKNGDIGPFPPAKECPELPANFAIPEREPSAIREHQAGMRDGSGKPVYCGAGFSRDQWRQYRWAYARLVALVDQRIGVLLDALEASGQAERTAVVLLSDHGDGNSAHHWHQKNIFYEETARVPFIVVPPGGQAPREDRGALVNACLDLFPTLLDYAGITIPDQLPGRSVRAVVEERVSTLHNQVVSQTNLAHGFDRPGPRHGRMLRTDRYKYVVFDGGDNPEQLFDLDADPGETRSLAHLPEAQAILQEHRELLDQWIRDHGDFFRRP